MGVISPEQQERWVRARARRSLDPTAPEFGRSGLFGQLDGEGIGVLVVPADDLAQPVEFDDEVLSKIPERFTGRIANGVAFLHAVTTTSDALVRYDPLQGSRGFRAFAAVERCGGVQVGIGSTARYEVHNPYGGGQGPPALRLYALAHLVQVAVHLQSAVLEWAQQKTPAIQVEGPFEALVAIPNTSGMVLGGLNEGWEEPEQAFEPPRSREANVLVRVQVAEWPMGEDENRDLALRILDRSCQAFGDRDRRFLSLRGQNSGTMPQGYA